MVADTVPDGPVPVKRRERGYPADTWAELQPMDSTGGGDYYDEPPTVTYRVGQTRTFHAHAVACKHAEKWTAHGCTVHIERSKPIEWETEQ